MVTRKHNTQDFPQYAIWVANGARLLLPTKLFFVLEDEAEQAAAAAKAAPKPFDSGAYCH